MYVLLIHVNLQVPHDGENLRGIAKRTSKTITDVEYSKVGLGAPDRVNRP